MGGACSRKSNEAPSAAAYRSAIPEDPQPHLSPRQPALRSPHHRFSPLPLVDLCVLRIAQHLTELPTPHLPAELTAKVLAQLVSRAWLDLDTLKCLRECPILALELPGQAQIDTTFLPTITAHTELVRLDLSAAPSLTNAAVGPIGRMPSLRALNLSACTQLSDGALTHISQLKALRLLKIEALPRVTDAGVASLEKLHALRWLSVAGCTAIKDASATSIRKVGGQLEYLSVQKCSHFTDDALRALVTLTSLRTFMLGWCFRISADALTSLTALTRLTCLDLAHTRLDDAGLAVLAEKLGSLRELSLRGCPITDYGLNKCPGHLSKLEKLSLRTCEVGSGAAESLAAMARLKELDLAYTELSDAGLLALTPLTRLR